MTDQANLCAYCDGAIPLRRWSRDLKYCGHDCYFAAERAKGAARFWAKVDKGGVGGCWLYTGFRKWDGYGWLVRRYQGRNRYMTAHRYAWILTNGEPPADVQILHRCDNPPCCNPAHLFLGTHAENHADKVAKGRHAHGERNRHVKLTVEKVAEIRRDFRRYSPHKSNSGDLAKQHGVNVGTIYAVIKGKTWKLNVKVSPLYPDRVRPARREA